MQKYKNEGENIIQDINELIGQYIYVPNEDEVFNTNSIANDSSILNKYLKSIMSTNTLISIINKALILI